MTACPSCETENIPGSDYCDGCGQSLSDAYLTEPATEVERSLLRDRIGVLSPKPPVSVPSSTPVGDVLRLLIDRKIGSVLVMDGDHLVGIFSERDALMKINANAAALRDRPISDFMTPNPRTLVGTAKVAFAVKEMDLGGYRHIPIVREGAVKGIISVRDILRYLTEKMALAK